MPNAPMPLWHRGVVVSTSSTDPNDGLMLVEISNQRISGIIDIELPQRCRRS